MICGQRRPTSSTATDATRLGVGRQWHRVRALFSTQRLLLRGKQVGTCLSIEITLDPGIYHPAKCWLDYCFVLKSCRTDILRQTANPERSGDAKPTGLTESAG